MSATFAQDRDRCGWPQVILFDLDGTLVDSAPDIRTAVNRLLGEHGHDPLTLDEVRTMIGHGIRKLVERAFLARGVALADASLGAETEMMMAFYADHLTVETVLMPGAAEMIAAYHGARVKIGVVTNKPEGLSREILTHFGLAGQVDVVVGGDTGPARKPAPDMLIHAVRSAGFGPTRALMVGDSPADIDAAKGAGMASIAVRGGYTNVPADALGAHDVIDSLLDLPRALEALKKRA